jgi:hypothetical protein
MIRVAMFAHHVPSRAYPIIPSDGRHNSTLLDAYGTQKLDKLRREVSGVLVRLFGLWLIFT